MTAETKIELLDSFEESLTGIDARHDSGEWLYQFNADDPVPAPDSPLPDFLDPCSNGDIGGLSTEDYVAEAEEILRSAYEATAETSTQPEAAGTDVRAVRESPLPITLFFTHVDVDPYDELEWESDRTAVIPSADG